MPDRPRTSLGADLAAPGIVAAEEARAAGVEEFRTVTADEADLASIFITFDPDCISGGEPGGVAELQFLGSLGLSFTNADTPPSGEFRETLRVERALMYPADVVFSTCRTVEELQDHSVQRHAHRHRRSGGSLVERFPGERRGDHRLPRHHRVHAQGG